MAEYERPDHGDAFAMEPRPEQARKLNDDDMLRLARERAVAAQDWWQKNHNLSGHDVDFVEGDQWSAQDLQQRAGQPSLSINGLAAYVEQVTGEQRQNRPAINVRAADDLGASQQYTVGDGKTTRKVAGAELYSGIIRAIEFNSGAEAHYDAVHRHAVEGGFGYLRVLTRYANGRDFDQELLIKRIKNRWSVLMDPDFEEPDAADANYVFVGKDMLRTEFDRRYPSARVGDLTDEKQQSFWSASLEKVRVTEYFTREPIDRELLLFTNGQTAYLDEVKDVVDDLERQGVTIARRRKLVDWCVYWRLITAWEVLEGPIKLPFRTIPIIPVFGRERNLKSGETVYSSLIRHAKDPQRMSNYWWSAATARIGNAPKSQWVADAESIEGYENEWARANDASGPAVLRYNGDTPPRREPPPPMPVAEVQMATGMSSLVRDTIGIGSPGMADVSSDASGKALRTRQAVANTGTFAFTDNLSLAMRRIGLLLVEAIPKIYDTERVVAMLGEDRHSASWAKVNQIVVDEETGRETVINALGTGEYDVNVTTGPTYATLREEAADGQMQLLQIAPNLAPVIGDIIAENMDWPQAKRVAERIRRSIPPQLLSPEEQKDLQEDQQPQVGPDGQPQPSPEEQAAQQQAEMAQAQQQAAMQVLQAETAAKMAKAQADTATAQAKAKAAEADMLEATLKMQALQAGGLLALKQQPPSSAPGPVQINPQGASE